MKIQLTIKGKTLTREMEDEVWIGFDIEELGGFLNELTQIAMGTYVSPKEYLIKEEFKK